MVEFEEMLYFQGFKDVLRVFLMIFGNVESGEMLDFSGFARSRCRSDLG